jgi:ArsR family transcriptional regulator
MSTGGEPLVHFKASVLKALADPIRLNMIELLRRGEWCVCDIVPCLKIAQPLVSRHLKILKERGIIKFRKEGNKRYYSITDSRIYEILDALDEDLLTSLSDAITQYSNINPLRGGLA